MRIPAHGATANQPAALGVNTWLNGSLQHRLLIRFLSRTQPVSAHGPRGCATGAQECGTPGDILKEFRWTFGLPELAFRPDEFHHLSPQTTRPYGNLYAC